MHFKFFTFFQFPMSHFGHLSFPVKCVFVLGYMTWSLNCTSRTRKKELHTSTSLYGRREFHSTLTRLKWWDWNDKYIIQTCDQINIRPFPQHLLSFSHVVPRELTVAAAICFLREFRNIFATTEKSPRVTKREDMAETVRELKWLTQARVSVPFPIFSFKLWCYLFATVFDRLIAESTKSSGQNGVII